MSSPDGKPGERDQQAAETDTDSIAILDGLASKLEEDGDHLVALRYRERALILRSEKFGLMAPEVSDACEKLVLVSNTVAMQLLQDEGQREVALELLSKAEMLTERKGCLSGRPTRAKLRAVTFNNLGCFYKLQAKMHTALQYVERALKLELGSPACDNPAGTHLNLCAILSHLGRHKQAAEHAKSAVRLLEFEVTTTALEAEDGVEPLLPTMGPGPQPASGAKEGTSVLAIAYYNLGAELEHLKQHDRARPCYERACEACEKELGFEHPMTVGMRQSLQAFEEVVNGLQSPRSSSPRRRQQSYSPRSPVVRRKNRRGRPSPRAARASRLNAATN